ncbi:hypothetical protein GW17_00023525 [Ensete ventricosum]|nr:hypothetical protein GW17_00023525 [Ensete ventricosum]
MSPSERPMGEESPTGDVLSPRGEKDRGDVAERATRKRFLLPAQGDVPSLRTGRSGMQCAYRSVPGTIPYRDKLGTLVHTDTANLGYKSIVHTEITQLFIGL